MRMIELFEEQQSIVAMQVQQLLDDGKPVYISIKREQIDGTIIKTAVFGAGGTVHKLVKNEGLVVPITSMTSGAGRIFFVTYHGHWMSVDENLIDEVMTIEKSSTGDWVVTPVK